MLRARDLRVRYGRSVALAGVGLEARPGRVLGLIGPNGSGKSSLLRAFVRAVDSTGTLVVGDDDVRRLRTAELARRTALVSQQEEPALSLSVGELVLLGRSVHRSGWVSYTAEDRRLAAEAMDRTGVTHLAHRGVAGLSGGERQRVLVARALAQHSPYLLLDEPTNHLDARYQHEVLALVRDLGLTTVVVLHDLNLAARYCDDLVLLDAGTLVATGTPEEVLVPAVLEPVYRVRVTPVDVDGVHQLVLALPRDQPQVAPARAP
ncbi:ABC transporter ATP-binding protein [Cellulosimicrobium marinum]|uniref:ABC transporter ATP-binding protein n=1 Tax=Cellulosimicrobium marinum TaxID=1638992 RepID=UPI001E3FE810|nr:ABC transporter ATP-binding protein [Cellulosimicrobium marinum]MCB7135617.1 ABC transporter ATP-binding protein [Cellulosimicrobium marinum]